MKGVQSRGLRQSDVIMWRQESRLRLQNKLWLADDGWGCLLLAGCDTLTYYGWGQETPKQHAMLCVSWFFFQVRAHSFRMRCWCFPMYLNEDLRSKHYHVFYSYSYTDQNQIMCVSLSASSALHKLVQDDPHEDHPYDSKKDSVNPVIVAQEDTNNSNLSKIISIHKVFI